jgi:coenzyme PQQ synthesis protein D (PqqD)
MNEPSYRRHPDLRLTSLEGEGVVLHLRERRYFSVSETGLVLLEALKQARTFDELVEGLLSEYEVDRETAVATTRAFLDQCLASAVVMEIGE